MDAAPERKLTTILVADAAGYSRMMGEDEAATLSLLRSYRELIGGQIARHRGRVVSTSGDNVLAEFASVVNAVECAVRIQRELAERNAGLPEVRRMRFRIGINLGDVLVEGDDLFGEGVNIAARLEQLADPDDILISGAVFEQVRTKLSLGFDFLGPQAVKNIADLVPVYRVNLNAEGSGAAGTFRSVASDWRARATERLRSLGDRGHTVPPRASPPPLPARDLRGRADRLPSRHQPFFLERHSVVSVARARHPARLCAPVALGGVEVRAWRRRRPVRIPPCAA